MITNNIKMNMITINIKINMFTNNINTHHHNKNYLKKYSVVYNQKK